MSRDGISRHPVSREYQDPMSVQNGRAFNEWLKTQLKAKKMSQRQLAQPSGVDHSTISRLVRGDRTPSLGTATKLARGLRELRDESETPLLWARRLVDQSPHRARRVRAALRRSSDEPQVRQVMEYYLALRMRRLAADQNGAWDALTAPRCAPLSRLGCRRATEHLTRRTGAIAPSALMPALWTGIFVFGGHEWRSLRLGHGLGVDWQLLGLGLVGHEIDDPADDDDRKDADRAVDQGYRHSLVGVAP